MSPSPDYTEFKIGNRNYSSNKFSVEDSLVLEDVLMPIVTGAVSRVVGAMADDFNGDAVAVAMEKLFSEIARHGSVELYKKILAETKVEVPGDDGKIHEIKCSNLNVAFKGHSLDLKQVIGEVLKFNFEHYFTGVREKIMPQVEAFLARQGITLDNATKKSLNL